MAEGQAAGNKIIVTIKTPKTKELLEVDENAEIKDVSIFRKLILIKLLRKY